MADFNVHKVFDEMNDFSSEEFHSELNEFLLNFDKKSKKQLCSEFIKCCDELVALKKSSDSLYDDYGKLCDLARDEGYFFCVGPRWAKYWKEDIIVDSPIMYQLID